MAYVVVAKWTANDGEEDRIARICDEMTEPSRAEPANRFYQAHRTPDNPRLFYLYEQYDDEAGYEAHMASEHFTRLVKNEAIPNLEAREREFYETLHEARERVHGARRRSSARGQCCSTSIASRRACPAPRSRGPTATSTRAR